MTREQQSPLTPPSLPTKRSRGRPRKDAHTPSDLSEQALPPTPQSLQRPPSISSTATSDKDTPESPQVEGAGRRRRSSRLAPKKGLASPAASLSEASASAKPMVTVDSSSESVVEIIVPHVTFNGLKSIDTTGNDGTLSRKHTRAAQDSDAARPAKRKVVRSPTASSGLSWTVSSDDSDSDFTEPLLRSPGINGRRRSLRRSVKASLLAQSSDESMPFTGATSPVKPESKQGTGIGERTTQGEAASVSFDDDNDEDYREDGDDDDDDDDDDGSQLDQEDDGISHETRDGPTSDTESEEVTEYIPRSRQQTRRAPKKRRGGKNAVKSLEEYIKNGEMPPKRPKSMNFHQWTTYCLHYYHPELKTVWEDLEQQIAQKCQKQLTPCAEQPRGLKLSLLPFQREGLAWLREQEAGRLSGGILADEMGMGKTIQMISLMLSEPRVKPTLVVAPTVALMQWKSELTTHTSDLSVLVYYGANRTQEDQTLLDHDVVITTYSVLESVFRRSKYGVRRNGVLVKDKSVLHEVNWARVVLDEAHNIKDRTCNTARAAFSLKAERKWCLSGTPLQNRVGELYSLIRFLGADPFGHYFCRKCSCKSDTWNFSTGISCGNCGCPSMFHLCWWNHEILKPIQKYGPKGEGMDGFRKLNLLLDTIMLRRTKDERAEDLGLPPRVVTTRRDMFNDEESDLYVSLFTNTRRQFNTYISHGTVLNNYANIFELITKMRLAVNHPDLLTVKLKMRQNASRDGGGENLVCVICNDYPEDPVISKCKHVFCREDIRQYIETDITGRPKCPRCFAQLTIDLSQPTYEIPQSGTSTLGSGGGGVDNAFTTPQTQVYRKSIINHIDMNRWRSSTKIEALIEELSKLRRSDATIKSIVFSQFVNFLDLVQWRLNRAGFSVCRLDGQMGPMQRDAVINAFMTRPEYTVFLVSLKAGGVALNLTEASHIFICDPWWNPAVEDQAMDRIHRLGQRRPIKITKLIVENSIESRIVELQKKKQSLFASTIGRDSTALARLSEEDLQFLFTN